MKLKLTKITLTLICCLCSIGAFFSLTNNFDTYAQSQTAEWASGNSEISATFNYDLKNSVYGQNGWYYGAKTENTDLSTKNTELKAEGFWTEENYTNMNFRPLFYQSVVGADTPSINLGYYSNDFMMSSHAVQSGKANSSFYPYTSLGPNKNVVDASFMDYNGVVYTFTDLTNGNYFNVKILSPGGSDGLRERSIISVSYNGGAYDTNNTRTAYYFGGQYAETFGASYEQNKYTFNFLNIKYDKEANVIKHGTSLSSAIDLSGFGIPAFNSYKVDLEFLNVKNNKTAGLMVYFLNGYALNKYESSADLDLTDKVIYSKTNVIDYLNNAIFNINDLVGVWNSANGEISENLSVTVSSPSHSDVVITDGSFVATEKGQYVVNASLGSLSLTFKLDILNLDDIPLAEINLSKNLPTSVGVGGTLYLPTASFTFDNQETSKGYIVVSNPKQEVIAYFEDITAINKIDMEILGDYTISYVYNSKFDVSNVYNYVVECAEILAIVDPCLPGFIGFTNDGYRLEQPKAVIGNVNISANVSVFSPSGEEVELIDGLLFVPNELGIHTFKYSATYKGQVIEENYTANVQYTSPVLFSQSEGVDQLISNVDVKNVKNTDLNGLAVIASTSGSSVTFKNVVDLTKLGRENIIEFQPLTEADGYKHISQVIVTLTDVYDENNTIKVKWERNNDAFQYAYVSVNPMGYGYYGKDRSNGVIYKNQYGTNSISSFYTDRYSGKYAFSFCLDYENREFMYKTGSGSYVTIIDADNIAHVGDGKQWNGFTTGEVYISLEIPTMNNPGGVIITSIAGQTLSGLQIVDETAPSIVVDLDEYYLSQEMAEGLVGVKYPIPNAYATDIVSGRLEALLKVEVYKQSSWVEVNVEEDTFIPAETGSYRFVWSAKDLFGNSVEKIVSFEVKEALSAFDATLLVPMDKIYVGEKTYISDISVSGGSGIAEATIKWLYNNEEISLNNPCSFTPYEDGKLVAVVSIKDYLGRTAEKNIEIIVENPELPVISVFDVPTSAINGANIILPDFTAIDYQFESDEQGYFAQKKILVNGVEIDFATRSYSVVEEAGNQILVEYIAIGKNGQSQKTFYIDVIKPTYIKDYLIYDRSTVSANLNKDYTEFVSSQDYVVKCPNPVSTQDLNIGFYYDEALLLSGGKVKVSLVDYSDSSIELDVNFIYNNDKLCLYLNNDTSKLIEVKQKDCFVSFVYNNVNKQLNDSNGSRIVGIDNTLAGTKFEGFVGGGAIVKFEMQGVTTDVSFKLNQIGNQKFVTTYLKEEPLVYTDRTAGQLSYEFDIDTKAIEIGQIITIPSAKAFDVLQNNASVTVTVQSPTKTILNNVSIDKTLQVTTEEYGYYKVVYTVKSGARTDKLPAYIINVKDMVSPTITVSKEVNQTVKVGSSLSLPSAVVSDNVTKDIKLYVFVITPNGKYINVTESMSYIFDLAGKYRVVYYAVDGGYNNARVEYIVNAK